LGIPRGTARLLLDEARREPFGGRLLELGRMTVYATDTELARWAAEQRVALAPVDRLELSHQPELARLGCLSDRDLFRRLGFAEVESADVSDWEGADLVLDLNQPVPAELHGRYDAVLEAGTIQHVFDLPRVFENIHALLRPGGRAIHGMAPSSNHVDHGFYMFSPTLFHDFYAANGWRLDAEYFFEFTHYWHRGRFHSPPWAIRRYTPGGLDHLAYGGFRGRQVGLFVVATRLPGATADRIPQQSCFARQAPAIRPAGGVPAPPGSAARALEPLLLRAKALRQWLRRRLPRRLPPVVARY
jgi:SAM-dependent methyltransferase